MLFRHDSEEIKRVAFQGHIMPGMGSNRICYKCIAQLAETFFKNENNFNDFLRLFWWMLFCCMLIFLRTSLFTLFPLSIITYLSEVAKCQVIILICKYQPRGFFLHHYLLITDLLSKCQVHTLLQARTTDARWGNRLHSTAENPLPIFRYGRSIFCLPHQSNFFDLCLHWVSVVRGCK